MKPTPEGWPRISSAIYYDDPAKAIDWLCEAFGFEVRIKVEGDEGRIEHSELTYGGGVVMVSRTKPDRPDSGFMKTPREVGFGNTQNLFMYVDDAPAHLEHARKAGAKIVAEMKTSDYGDEYWVDRGYQAEDLGGHHWWFSERLQTRGK